MWADLFAPAVLGAIGFTVSLLIAELRSAASTAAVLPRSPRLPFWLHR